MIPPSTKEIIDIGDSKYAAILSGCPSVTASEVNKLLVNSFTPHP
jgi:hypothetical protein